MMFLIWLGGRHKFKDFASEANAEAYVAAAKRNVGNYPAGHPRAHFSCKAVDLEEECGCTGLEGDPRHQGTHCYCRY